MTTVGSSSGSATDKVFDPPNQTASRVSIPFTVTVTGPSGTVSSTTTITELFGDFSGTGQSQVVLYSPSDQNWWLGTMSAGSLTWTKVANTTGFGNTVNDPTWTP